MHRALPFVPAGILAMGCALLLRAHTQDAVSLSGDLQSVLAEVPGYRVREQKFTPEEERIAGMTSYVARAYLRDSAMVFSTLVSYYDRQTQGKTIHSPRNCLPGAGWEIVSGGPRTVVVDGAPHVVNRYVLKNGQATAIAYYWYQGRGRVASNEYAVKWHLLRDAALLGRTEEALIRVVVPVPRHDSLRSQGFDADALATATAARLIAEVDRVLPARPGTGS
jgi:EpsI family protein